MHRLFVMSTCGVGVVRGSLVVACVVVLRRFLMVPRRVGVMFRRFSVMVCGLSRHDRTSAPIVGQVGNGACKQRSLVA
jgi:hypothetical protein